MKELLLIFKDVYIPLLVAIIISLIGNKIKIDNSIVEQLISFSPVIISTFVIAYNKPIILKKFNMFYNRDIGIKYTTKVDDVEFTKEQYKRFIYKFLDTFTKQRNKKIIYEDIGEDFSKSILQIGYLNLEITYKVYSNELVIDACNNINTRQLHKLVKKLDFCLKESIAVCGTGHSKFITRIRIEFLSETDKVTVPMLKKLYGGFNITTVSLRYITKNNSTISYSNKFIDINNENSDNLIKDLKNELMLW